LSLTDLAEAWIVLWGISYLITAAIAPHISDTPPFIYGILGFLLLFFMALRYLAYDNLGYYAVSTLFFAMSLLMVYSAVASWTGLGLWNVPFPSKEPFQISMAFLDMFSAIFLYLLAKETYRKTK
jgi:hypothetical protein